MVKSNKGMVAIVGDGATVAVELEMLIADFINEIAVAKESRVFAEETIDKIVKNAKKRADVSGSKQKEVGVEVTLEEVMEKIMKDILEVTNRGRSN